MMFTLSSPFECEVRVSKLSATFWAGAALSEAAETLVMSKPLPAIASKSARPTVRLVRVEGFVRIIVFTFIIQIHFGRPKVTVRGRSRFGNDCANRVIA